MDLKVRVDLSPMGKEEIFTWTSDDQSITFHFRVSCILRFLEENPEYAASILVESWMDPAFAAAVKLVRGIESDRLTTIMSRDLFMDKPTVSINMPNGTVLLIDGNHRYYARYLNRKPTVMTYVLPEGIWRLFLLEDEFWEKLDKVEGRKTT